MAEDAKPSVASQPKLFDLPEGPEPEPKVKPVRYPIWTENKARLIERYLYYFVLVTKHGDYIDGFAGPQDPDSVDTWAARLVLESDPRWLRKFYLFDASREQVKRLEQLVGSQKPRDSKKKEPKRIIEVQHGDFNDKVAALLKSGAIKESEATFCLLDQRTFECRWSTLEALARHKAAGNKIELFYFLPNSWLDRAFAAVTKSQEVVESWWGKSDWDKLIGKKPRDRAAMFVERFKKELGYWSVKPWPIYERQDSSNIMYYMIHATDHPDAPSLMSRAYNKAVQPKEEPEQFLLEFGLPEEEDRKFPT